MENMGRGGIDKGMADTNGNHSGRSNAGDGIGEAEGIRIGTQSDSDQAKVSCRYP